MTYYIICYVTFCHIATRVTAACVVLESRQQSLRDACRVSQSHTSSSSPSLLLLPPSDLFPNPCSSSETSLSSQWHLLPSHHSPTPPLPTVSSLSRMVWQIWPTQGLSRNRRVNAWPPYYRYILHWNSFSFCLQLYPENWDSACEWSYSWD